MRKEQINLAERFNWKWVMMVIMAFVLSLPVSAKLCHACPEESYRVNVASGYLALRNAQCYDASNEIGELYNSDTVDVINYSGTYWYVYSPKYGRNGYVDSRYLVIDSTPSYSYSNTTSTSYSSYPTKTVRVEKNYLALRNAKAYDAANEIGRLYTGDVVNVIDSSDSAYWWVYSSKLGKEGYVNKDYLFDENVATTTSYTSYPAKTVYVEKNYLALRSAKAYDDANEIGRMYPGETVYVMDSSDDTYWTVYSPTLGKTGYTNKNYLY